MVMIRFVLGVFLSCLIQEALVMAFIGVQKQKFHDVVCSHSSHRSSLLPYDSKTSNNGIDASFTESLNFIGDVVLPDYPRLKRGPDFQLLEVALLRYKELNGDLLVPQRFVIPHSEKWPQETWSINLGSAVCSIRRGSYKPKHEMLAKLGFCFNISEAKYELAKAALLQYKKLHGDMMVLASFVVPEGSTVWPQEMWELKLGMIVRNIRGGDSYMQKRSELTSIGFTYDSLQTRYEITRAALFKYKELHGDLLVPWKFEVPKKSADWPRQTWGLHLGFIVGSIRRGSYSEKREELEAMGFNYEPQVVRYGYEAIRQALLYYQDSFGDMIVPANFEVPSKYGNWPPRTVGMKLGYTAKDIKYGRIYADRREDLMSLGFDFNIVKKKITFDVIMMALLNYKELYGDLLIPQMFSVPSEIPDNSWPVETQGMQLGAVVGRIRSGYYIERKQELLDIGFTYSVRKKFTFDCFKTAVDCYHSIHGHQSKIPSKFKIAQGDVLYPESVWGMSLGNLVQRVKSGSLWPDEDIAPLLL